MNPAISCLFALLFCLSAQAQQKEFEGVIVYKSGAKSKMPGVSEQTVLAMIGSSDTVTVAIKRGNFLQSSKSFEHYYIRDDEKIYIHFKGIDTLYYIPYAMDTTTIVETREGSALKNIAGYDCRSFTIKTASATTTYYYSPQLYANPEDTRNLLLSHLNLLGEKTKSVWLANESESIGYTTANIALRIEAQRIDDSLFKLPPLPITLYHGNVVVDPPEFTLEKLSWARFMQKNVQAELAARYLKFRKGEDQVSQTVYVGFVVAEDGTVLNARALNRKEVHPALAAEAIRVISLSQWKPGKVYGKIVPYPLIQPVTFVVANE